jgi:hypothetical protein
MPKTNGLSQPFEGFGNPNYTPVPDVVFDELAYQLTDIEFRVLLYIVRRTFGFKKTSDDISLKQLVEGIRTKEGHVLDRGAAVSKDEGCPSRPGSRRPDADCTTTGLRQ